MLLIAGILGFDILDRVTGSWTVMDSEWMQDFADPLIKNYPITWFAFNMLFWAVVAFASVRFLQYFVYAAGGMLTLRLRIMQRVKLERLNVYIATKNTTIEERLHDEHNTPVRVSWVDMGRVREFGGVAPRITLEYDRSTAFLHSVIIEYNRRAAKK
jgi:hypothetical protein